MNSKQLMTKAADNIRILAAAMVEKAKSGHPGGSMHIIGVAVGSLYLAIGFIGVNAKRRI